MRGFLPPSPHCKPPPWATRLVWASLVVTLLSLGLFVSSASATVMKYAGLERLIEISDTVIHGEVIDQNTYFDKKQKRVVTDTTFNIKRTFWGDATEKVTIQQWGGTYNGQTHFIPGDARFEVGEEVVVFLHSGDNVVALSALGQAKFSVEDVDGKKLVTRDLSDIAFLMEAEGQKKITHRPEETQSFESFVAELESLVAGIKGGKSE